MEEIKAGFSRLQKIAELLLASELAKEKAAEGTRI